MNFLRIIYPLCFVSTLAGISPKTLLSGTSFVTTASAANVIFFPILIGAKIAKPVDRLQYSIQIIIFIFYLLTKAHLLC